MPPRHPNEAIVLTLPNGETFRLAYDLGPELSGRLDVLVDR